jgi:hypothetical protein
VTGYRIKDPTVNYGTAVAGTTSTDVTSLVSNLASSWTFTGQTPHGCRSFYLSTKTSVGYSTVSQCDVCVHNGVDATTGCTTTGTCTCS